MILIFLVEKYLYINSFIIIEILTKKKNNIVNKDFKIRLIKNNLKNNLLKLL